MTKLSEENIETLLENAVDFTKMIEIIGKDKLKLQIFKNAMINYNNSRMKIIKEKSFGKTPESFEEENNKMLRFANTLLDSFEEFNSEENVMEYATIQHDDATKVAFSRCFVDNWNKTVYDYNFSLEKYYIDYED